MPILWNIEIGEVWKFPQRFWVEKGSTGHTNIMIKFRKWNSLSVVHCYNSLYIVRFQFDSRFRSHRFWLTPADSKAYPKILTQNSETCWNFISIERENNWRQYEKSMGVNRRRYRNNTATNNKNNNNKMQFWSEIRFRYDMICSRCVVYNLHIAPSISFLLSIDFVRLFSCSLQICTRDVFTPFTPGRCNTKFAVHKTYWHIGK